MFFQVPTTLNSDLLPTPKKGDPNLLSRAQQNMSVADSTSAQHPPLREDEIRDASRVDNGGTTRQEGTPLDGNRPQTHD